MEIFDLIVISGREYAKALTDFLLQELEKGETIEKISTEKIQSCFDKHYFEYDNIFYPIQGIDIKDGKSYLVNYEKDKWKLFLTDVKIFIFLDDIKY